MLWPGGGLWCPAARGAGRGWGELSFAAELPGKEFPATANPFPKDSISRNYPLPPHWRLPLLFQVSLWLGAMCVETRAEQIHGNVGGWSPVLARFTVHGSYLHRVPRVKKLGCSLLATSLVSAVSSELNTTRSSEATSGANKNKGRWGFFLERCSSK